MKVAILSGTSPSWNPRAAKEAMALARAGYSVVVFGVSSDRRRWESDSRLADRGGYGYHSVVPHLSGGRRWMPQRLLPRLRNRLAKRLHGAFGVESHWQLGSYAPELLRSARASGAGYFIVHLEEAAWVGCALLREGCRVGIDLEDWYSEDLPPEAQRQRPIRLLRGLERKLLREGFHTTCPSRAMSSALGRAYDCAAPAVIYNAFPWSDRASMDGLAKDREGRRRPSIHWYSQTLGMGRGLEDLIAALPFVRAEAEVHLRGQPAEGFEGWLRARIPEGWRDRLFLHGLVPNGELLSRIAEHDIGFAGEMKYCRNKDLTVSNKILHYLLGGLVVVASDTAGQREIADQVPAAVAIYPSGDAVALADTLSRLLTSPDELREKRAVALQVASQIFCWEVQEKVLLETVDRALGRSSR